MFLTRPLGLSGVPSQQIQQEGLVYSGLEGFYGRGTLFSPEVF